MTENTLVVAQGTAMMPAMNMAQATHRRNELVRFVRDIMVKGVDFGAVPGTEKATLLKPGAEKLTTFFGLAPRFEIIKSIEQWDGDEPMFYYLIRCRLFRGDVFVGEADASCNSRESRYRFRWVQEGDIPQGTDVSKLRRRGGKGSEFTFAIDKAETGGKYGKPTEYWQAFTDAIDGGTARKFKKATSKGKQYDAYEIDMAMYRVPNEDIFSQVNTILKMAEKRALVAATLVTVNASEFFTQDLEDLDIIDVPHTATVAQPVPEPVKQEPKRQPVRPHIIDAAVFDGPPPDIGDPEPATVAKPKPPVLGLPEDTDLDYTPEWINDDEPRPGMFWGKLYRDACKHLGYANDSHVKGALANIYEQEKWSPAEADTNYATAWYGLQDHQRSKVGDARVDEPFESVGSADA